ncbi:MAG: Gfo/Idh/MocA family oxidoreductase [Armatimonadetes bacterium]|nr:Gfo/Idh/MocA family oxidoreductase [Armatimonadota bacterium]
MSHPVEAVLLGAGSRGFDALGSYALRHPDELRLVAVAEPDPEKLARAAAAHGIPPERCFRDWQELLAQPQLAPGLINATMDQVHVPSTIAALEAGYHVLCEKPMATTPHDCVRLVRAAERAGRQLQICHVLRYAPFWMAIKQVIERGELGQLWQVQHTENVVYWHQAHSFVRGNWGNEERSAPMILAKCCHDLDLLVWQLGPCRRLSSFGHLSCFREEQAPPGAGQRCLDCGIEPDCPYSAVRLYLNDKTGWPQNTISVDQSLEARRRALETGPYGRCVWRTDNSVVDHQVINLEFGEGVLVAFTMHGFSHENTRTVRYGGSRGTLRGHESGKLELHTYLPQDCQPVDYEARSDGHGHGGGDSGLMADFVETLRNPGREVLTGARASLESHLIAFAAEESRHGAGWVDMDEYRARIEAEVVAQEAVAKTL